MIKHFQTTTFSFLLCLLAGCGVKQEEVDRIDKILASLKKDINKVQDTVEEEPDPNALTPESVDAKYDTITGAFTSDIAGVQTSIADLESQLQTLRENLATAMSQLVAKNTELNVLQGQISSLEADKQTAQQALSDQVRESEARVTRFEKAADALFDSVVVQQYREQNPGSTKSNQQLTLELGNHFSQLGKFDILAQTDPSFAAKYEQAKTLSRLD